MAAIAPMRDGPPAGSGTGDDSRVTTISTSSAAAATTSNFEYDDNEWEIGIGNLIIDLDADIEKTNEKINVSNLTTSASSSSGNSSMAAASVTSATSGAGNGSSGKANKSNNPSSGNGSTTSGGAACGSGGGGSTTSSSALEHLSTVENKSLKMKIKRTKSGSKSSEKHEIVKPNEQNGGDMSLCNNIATAPELKISTGKHSINVASGSINSCLNSTNIASDGAVSNGGGGSSLTSSCNASSVGINKRGSSSHRRDKTKDKHSSSGGDKGTGKTSTTTLTSSNSQASSLNQGSAAIDVTNSGSVNTDVPGVVRIPVQRVMFPIQTNGPGQLNITGSPASSSKDQQSKVISTFTSNAIPTMCATQPTSCAQLTTTSIALSNSANAAGGLNQSIISAAVSTTPVASSVNNIVENGNSNYTIMNAATGCSSVATVNVCAQSMDDGLLRPSSPSSPPCKKLKTAICLTNENKEMKDVCIGTSISTMTEPDCLGPCEPGTSVTLEGIVWHETEGVLVVNVTWRGKTYVGTLLDCTRHDWAPPRFCDSPTSDLDTRLPKGRAKRGRAAANDLSSFTETRSSVHSKLRSSSSGSNKSSRKGLSNSPTPFVSPRPDSGGNKRKSRPPEEESTSPQSSGKKNKPSSQTTSLSPPSSPVYFECPEANCCKKYRHLNGLKYHQSHAHGGSCAGDDDDATKESGSMSENDEILSPADPQSIKFERKDENSESELGTPISESVSVSIALPGSPHTQSGVLNNLTPELEPIPLELTPPTVDNKTVVKPGVLRYLVPPSNIEKNASQPSTTVNANLPTTVAGIRSVLTPISSLPTPLQTLSLNSTATVVTQSYCSKSPSPPSITQQISLSPSQTISAVGLPHPFPTSQQMQSPQPVQSLALNPTALTKSPHFKVKPSSTLMQDDRMKDKSKGQIQRKKSRKSTVESPHLHPMEQPQYKIEEAHSPAYSDISDDGAPVLEAEVADPKNKPLSMDKKTVESSTAHSPHAMQHFNVYPFYGQPPFLVPSVQPDMAKSKDDKAQDTKMSDKEKRDGEMSQKLLTTHFYSYDSYVPNYSYNLSQNYAIAMVSNNEKEIKEESKSPGPTDLVKQSSSTIHPSQSVGQYSTCMNNKSKMVDPAQGKIQNESYGLVKDVTDARNPINASSAYLHARQQQQQQHQQIQQMQQMQTHPQQASLHQSQTQQQQQMQQQVQQHQLNQAHQQHQSQQQQLEDMRRFYGNMYSDQRRKEQQQHTSHSEAPLKATPPSNTMNLKSNLSLANTKHKEKQTLDEKKEAKAKQEGVKPTMETQGPPPPPTSSYAYFTPGFIQSPYMPFDASHSMYRTLNPMMVPTGPYGNSPYLPHPAQMHPQMPRYHAPEDLSRPPSGSATKALDLLHHQASQYYPSSHKIHELQERAIKSPTPKSLNANPSPTAGSNGQPPSLNIPQLTPMPTSDRLSSGGSSQNVKSSPVDGKDSRSPPPQRHVHTHHHTHVGLGYPLLAGQYGSPYGAAVLASEQAAAVASASSNPYSPK